MVSADAGEWFSRAWLRRWLGTAGLVLHAAAGAGAATPAEALRDSAPIEIGRGGGDGFLATSASGAIHVVIGGKYRSGKSADSLAPAEAITDVGRMHGVRIAVDAQDQPHVVFTTGATDNAKQSFYTARVAGRWRAAEKFADAADFPERGRAYVADVAVDADGAALVSFWVSRPSEKRAEFDNPSFYYRWRSARGEWSAPRSLPAHWSSAPKVEFAPGRGFYLMWQHRNIDWRIAGPAKAGETFSVEQSFPTGSSALTKQLTTIQNEGADFRVTSDGVFVVAGNIREKFEGPVGAWATLGRERALAAPVYLGSFPETVRGNESGVHPVAAFDAETGNAFLTLMDPRTKTARVAVYRKDAGWARVYHPLLPNRPAPQGALRQGPSVADVPGPGVLALIRDGEGVWWLRRLTAR